ncbi:MAG: heavy-metal-associated domain-containing protein [Burkholderiales bacterium]
METTQMIPVTGMTCGGCVASVTRVVERLAGVRKVDVSLAEAQAVVSFDTDRVSVRSIRDAIEKAGFGTADA